LRERRYVLAKETLAKKEKEAGEAEVVALRSLEDNGLAERKVIAGTLGITKYSVIPRLSSLNSID
jgi:hypothetical protein